MVSSITGSQSSNILAGLSPQQTTPSGSMASFTDQLAAALEGYLAQSGNGSNLQIDIQTTQSQNSGVRQFLVTVKNPDSAPATTPHGSDRRSVRSPGSDVFGPSLPLQPSPQRAERRRYDIRGHIRTHAIGPARWRDRCLLGRAAPPFSNCATSRTSVQEARWRSSWPIRDTPSTRPSWCGAGIP